MKAGLAMVAALVVAVALLVTVFDDTTTSNTGACITNPGNQRPGGVPPGKRSLPMHTTGDGKAVITSGFHDPTRADRHEGIDFAAPIGAPIFAVADGVVALAGPASGFGNWIVIDHTLPDGSAYSTVYGHMSSSDEGGTLVQAGDAVRAGQHIANEGDKGEVTGPHLHLELWEGGRLTGGTAIDPNAWLTDAVEPGTETSTNPDTAGPSVPAAPPSDVAVAAAPPVTELSSPLPADVGSEVNLQINAIRVARAVHAYFPQITDIGGWRPSDQVSPDHPNGVAIDIMIPDFDSDLGRQLGDSIRDFVWANREQFHLTYLIWRATLVPADGDTQNLTETGDLNADHYNHVHVSVEGHGPPTSDQTYGAAPQPGDPNAPASPKAPLARNPCTVPNITDDNGSDTLPDAVPQEFRRWLVISAKQCNDLTPELLGAQVEAESGYQPHGPNDARASGYTQFIPETWLHYGVPVDDNGNPTGPAGTGDPNNIGDAVMAQGHYMCDLAAELRLLIASGEVSGDPTALMLAAYNAGPGAVREYGGIPPYPETLNYVPKILNRAKELEAAINQ
ncbi:peptidoglycan DD-metalloendopeptidase family protein [Nocardia suismassiliense]|uniref:peptidoglycan DD-metalloendopeptidase family protein n=1 Tax=Nocardia suismassiliense TaxID=2077092 RepID=UPI000D1FA833|nr:peptidoglycan DD-metalloendopeptidase family protein [Nocardia suismassiliense]